MTILAGLKFKKVTPEYIFKESSVILIKDLFTGLMFVRNLVKNDRSISIKRFGSSPTKLLKLHRNAVDFEYYIHHETVNNKTPIRTLASNVQIELRKEGKLWANKYIVHKGVVTDIDCLKYYLYVMINQNTGAIYIDYDHSEKCLKNPMKHKASTYNGFVQRNIVHSNRTMHRYTMDNYPLMPDAWIVNKIDDEIIGQSLAEKTVSSISVKLMREGFLILNRVHGVDSHYYRQHHSDLNKITINDYVSINRKDSYETLKARMAL